MTDHTPAPWRKGYNYVFSSRDDARKERIICRVRHYDSTPGEGEANARLMAAAPDLLEACEAMLARIAERYTDDDFEKDVPLARAVEDMRAAIRKAKGEGDDD